MTIRFEGRRLKVVALVAFFVLSAGASSAMAQDTSVRDILSFLLTNRAVSTGDFARDQQAAEATRDTMARALLLELTTLPITTSSGGFSFRFNPALGTAERVTPSFGPLFVDRATTAGRGQASVSFTYRYSSYESLDNQSLGDGTLITTANKFRDEAAPFDVDTLSLKIRSSTLTVFGNYGITDRLDLGVAVPLVHLTLSGQRVNTYKGAAFEEAEGSGQTAGIADIAVRGKLQLVRSNSGQLAGDFELRLPTGAVEDLRGTGHAAYRGSLIASTAPGRVEGHGNASLTFGGISREQAVSGALNVAPSERLTLSFEALARRIEALSAIQAVSQPNPLIAGMDTIRLLPSGDPTITVTAVGGFRWNLTSTWLLNGYVTMPLTNHGLKARPIPVVALDYSFVR
jgi:hypothetical protein